MARPRKYKTPALMQKDIDEFFELNKHPTICGLALHLGFAQRKSLLDYEGYGQGFCNTIKKAKLRVEKWYETNLLGNHATGAIFALKNFGWADKQEHIHDVTGELQEFIGQLNGKIDTPPSESED
jgi:hypothetical protein